MATIKVGDQVTVRSKDGSELSGTVHCFVDPNERDTCVAEDDTGFFRLKMPGGYTVVDQSYWEVFVDGA